MKKRHLVVLGLSALGLFGVTACGKKEPVTPTPPVEVTKYIVKFNSLNGGEINQVEVEDGNKITKPIDPTKDNFEFKGWYKEQDCINAWNFETDTVSANITLYAKWEEIIVSRIVTFDTQGGSEVADLTVNDNSKLTKPADPTNPGYEFKGWYKEAECNNAWDFETDIVSTNITLYAKWEKECEEVTHVLDVEKLDVGKFATEYKSGVFSITSGTEVRNRNKTWTNPTDSSDTISFTRSIKFGSDSSQISVDCQGEGKLYIYVQNGSSGAQTQFIIVTKPDGSQEEIEFDGQKSGSPVVKLEIPVSKGTYKFQRKSGTVDVFKVELNCIVEKAEESGFEIQSVSEKNYLVGRDFDSSTISLLKKYGNGRTEGLSINDANVTVDTSNYNKNASGEYTISIKYKDYDAQTFIVYVYEIEDISLGFNATEKLSSNTTAGNGVYFNQTVKRVYKLNEELSTKYLTVIASCKCGNKKLDFILKSNEITIDNSTFNSNVVGKKTIKVTANNTSFEKTFDVYVVGEEPSIVNNIVQLKVDQTYTGIVGTINDGYNTFTSIQQALDYLTNLDDSYINKEKQILLAAGTYKEKLEVTIPNLSIIGEGSDKTKIEWNSLYGIKDESGYDQVTDSTASLNIREQAVNFFISGVTVSNYWNSKTVFDQDLGEGYSEHRALALLVQADKFVMKNCKLLGYQDTVEFFTGRQYLENTYISGTTDFIFGTNNTTYFKNCEIHSITSGKTDGGYITAFKGCNKGDADYVEYGAIFDGCHFTADADVVSNANTAIGRCWGKYAAVMVMNSVLDGHISTQAFSGSSKNERYVSMNAKPDDATVKFTEYNNTGAGAITSSINGVTVITDATTAAKYNDLSIIFSEINGKLTYSDAWSFTE